MINLSRRAALGAALLLALVVALVFGLTVNTLAMRGSSTPEFVAIAPTAAASATPEPAVNTPTFTTQPPTATPEPPTAISELTATPEPPTEIPSVTAAPEPPTEIPAVAAIPGNLLGNASFEQAPGEIETRWSFNAVASSVESSWSTNVAHSGVRSLAISTTTFRQGGWPGWSTAAFIPIEKGKTYTFSAWAYSADGSSAWLGVGMYDGNGKFLVGYSTGCLPLRAQGEWQQLTRTVSDIYPNAAGATQVKLDMLQCGQSPSGSTVFYDDAFFGITSP